jgi:hypothetical protein
MPDRDSYIEKYLRIANKKSLVDQSKGKMLQNTATPTL